MKYIDRRDFLGGVLASGAALAASALPVAETTALPQSQPTAPKSTPEATPAHAGSAIDFRYSPVEYQTAFCFPDDKYKSLVSQSGTLLYGFDRSA